MIFIDTTNKNQILSFLPLIQDNYADWHVINLKFQASSKEEAKEIVTNYIKTYEQHNGFVYIENTSTAVSIIKLGPIENYSEIQNTIEKNIGDKRCSVRAQKMTSNGLKQIQINITDGVSKKSNFFKIRENRSEKIIMVVEDDMFIRKTMNSLLSNIAETVEVADGKDAVEQYKRCNPDIVIMDIHMPDSNGLEVIEQIMHEDSNAFILISSADSIRKNVLIAMEKGAAGFLAKPIQKEKIFGYIEQCITFQKQDEQAVS